MSHDINELNKHIKVYIGVFVALLVLTGLTVGVSYLHLDKVPGTIVGLLIALTKGTLVAGFFMHLFDEFREKKPVLFWSLATTIFMFLVLLLIPTFNLMNKLGGH